MFGAGQKSYPMPETIDSNVIPTMEAPKLLKVSSGDGKMKLHMSSQASKEGTVSYVFTVENVEADKKWPLFEKTVLAEDSMEIPANSWSPDNKQLFIQSIEGGVVRYYVFKTDNSLYKDETQYLDVYASWIKGGYKGKIKTVSGWAGPDLLVVYSTLADGSKGPLFWYVTGTQKLMQVAR